MSHKIKLPVSGLEVELVSMPWAEAKTFHKDGADYVKEEDNTSEDWMELVLRKHYPEKTLNEVFKNSPDAVALYNDTVRYNKLGDEYVKSSLRSGAGEPTQTA